MRDWDGATHQQLTHWIMTHQKRSEEVIYTSRHKKWSHRQGDITGNAFFVTQRTLCYYYCYLCMCWFSRPIIKESHLDYFNFLPSMSYHFISFQGQIWKYIISILTEYDVLLRTLVRGFAKVFYPNILTKNLFFVWYTTKTNPLLLFIISSNIFACVDFQGHFNGFNCVFKKMVLRTDGHSIL